MVERPPEEGYWIFRAHQDNVSLADSLYPKKKGSWKSGKERDDIRVGDLVWFWQGAREAEKGLYGWGRVIESPGHDKDGDFRVPVVYKERFDKPCPAQELHRLKLSLPVLEKSPGETFYRLDKGQHAQLVQALDQMGFSTLPPAPELTPDEDDGSAPMPDLEGVSTHATNDIWTVEDQLGYAEYARAIRHFLDDPRTKPPLTISIQAPWGGGKTSLMRMIQRELDPGGFARIAGPPSDGGSHGKAATAGQILVEVDSASRGQALQGNIETPASGCVSVWFNAWRYQSTNQVWAGLAEAVVRQLAARLPAASRERFYLRLHLSRIDAAAVRRRVYDQAFQRFLRVARWVALGGAFFVLALLGLYRAHPITALPWGVPSAILGTLAALAASYGNILKKVKSEPAQLNLSEFVDLPDYSRESGFVHHVAEDLHRVLALLPRDEDGSQPIPLAIFIDDLDRCSPREIAQVFEAINLFVSGEFPNCYFVIGMDTELVAAALEEAHKDVIEHLPTYIRRVPIGWRFMDKFVQLPFVIPPLDPQAAEDYADYLAASEDLSLRDEHERAMQPADADSKARLQKDLDDGKPVEDIAAEIASSRQLESPHGQKLARRIVEREKRLRFIDDRARVFKRDSDQIRHLVLEAREDFSSNPRELKRLVNVYRFYYNLRLARRAREAEVPTEAQLENWVKLSLAWPEVVRWLRRSYSEWEAAKAEDLETTAIGARLVVLEEASRTARKETRARAGAPAQAWSQKLVEKFKLPESTPWLSDERLFAFFRDQAKDGKLSDGAGRGFW